MAAKQHCFSSECWSQRRKYKARIVTYLSSRRSETVEIRGLVVGRYEPCTTRSRSNDRVGHRVLWTTSAPEELNRLRPGELQRFGALCHSWAQLAEQRQEQVGILRI
jgi:hypothetical protein